MKFRFSAAGLSLICALSIAACGDDGAEENPTSCVAGTQCPCTTSTDCPATEFCSAVIEVCLPANDAGSDGNTDTGDSGTEDTATDTSDVTPDAEVDTSVDTDTESDIEDTSGDTEDTLDVSDTPDTADAGDTDAADTDAADTTDGGVVPSTDDNPWIAYVSGGGVTRSLRFILADGSEHRQLVTTDTIVQAPVFSPDCTKLAYIGASLTDEGFAVRVVDLTTADSVQSTVAVAGTSPQELSWSPDGNTLALVQNDNGEERELVYLNATTLVATPRLSDRRVQHARFAGSGSTIYLRASESLESSTIEFYSMPFASGDPTRLTTDSESIGDFAVSEDGNFFAFQRNDGGPQFALWERDIDSYSNIGEAQDGDASFFGDGERIAITRVSGGAPNLFVIDIDGEELEQLTATTIQLSEPTVCRLDSSLIDITAATTVVP